MTRFAVDVLDVLLDLLRNGMPGVQVMSRIPDHVPQYLPLVVIRRVDGASQRPEFYDTCLVNVQAWAGDDVVGDRDAFRSASDLADQARGVLFTAYRTQAVVPGRGWLSRVRESTGPREIADPDLPLLGRYTATYEIRVRPST